MNLIKLKGIGPKKEILLKKMGIETSLDLLHHYPREYQDRTRISKLEDMQLDQLAVYRLRILNSATVQRLASGMTITKVNATDGFKSCNIAWFHNPYIKQKLRKNHWYYFFGRLKQYQNQLVLEAPELDDQFASSGGRIVPIYPKVKGLTNRDMCRFVDEALKIHLDEVVYILPQLLLDRYGFLTKKQALENIHFPKSKEMFMKARNRLIFDELFIMMLTTRLLKQRRQSGRGIIHQTTALPHQFQQSLPFRLTGAQSKIIAEIFSDMEKPLEMNRLIQGDVGSGKTIVAVMAILKTLANDYQAAMMAPTEILAKQHYENIQPYLQSMGYSCQLLTGKTSSREKEKILANFNEGCPSLIIGTHALIQQTIQFINLGLIIVDEQHRFGVKQRQALSIKGHHPDRLFMTATPIPRTLGLVLYGDLDISYLNEMPPGRKKIKTILIGMEKESTVWKTIDNNASNGNQIYIVCPMIEEDGKSDVVTVMALYQRIQKSHLRKYTIGLLHGKMSSDEKEQIMEQFRSGDIQILIATVVIEVGIDVPNANMMIVYNAERFGLAQLHQLRGRVGRGNQESFCFLINGSNNPDMTERLRILQTFNEGNRIAEQDMLLRGVGDFLGTRQHGLPALRIANIYRDEELVKKAETYAIDILTSDPGLELPQHLPLAMAIQQYLSMYSQDIILN